MTEAGNRTMKTNKNLTIQSRFIIGEAVKNRGERLSKTETSTAGDKITITFE